MISSKYLFSIVAGLTAGANGMAFGMKHNDPAGGGNQLSSALQNITNYYTKNNELTDLEATRLDKERSQSQRDRSTLETKNEDAKKKGEKRNKKGELITQEKDSLEATTKEKAEKLEQTKKEAESNVTSVSESFNRDIKSYADQYGQALKSKVNEEVQKIESTLKNMEESNRALIEKVKGDILKLPERIFEEGKIK